MRSSSRQVRQLSRQEALDKLGSVSVGRVLFSHRGLPAIRFVNHILDRGVVVIRDHGSDIAAVRTSGRALVIGYETDDMDSATRLGWSVTIIGSATLVEDPAEVARYRDTLHPWVTGETDHIVTIDPQSVTGYEVITAGPAGAPLPSAGAGTSRAGSRF